MKRFVQVMFGTFMVALGIVVGMRMSADAMAIVIGIALGLVATIPTTLLLVFTLRQQSKQQSQAHQPTSQYPPVVVVNAPPNGHAYGGGTPGGALLPPAGERSFKVVGQDATPLETLGDVFNINALWDESN
ncbi:MAG: hypothetical protein ACE5G8_02325 [Anaerolineae bacterium]